MPKVSRWPLEKEKLSLFFDDFWTAIASLKDKSEAKNFFNQFLTLSERKMLVKRFQVALMLVLDYDYESIRKRVKVSHDTIARISNWLAENRESLIEITKRIIKLKQEKIEKIYKVGGRRLKARSLGSSLVEEGFGQAIKKFKEVKKLSSLKK